MSLIPPPENQDHDTGEAPASMTLSAIGKGAGDGPLGIDGFGDDDASSGGSGGITQHGAFAIIVVAVVAAAVLGMMRLTTGRIDTRADAAIEGLIDQTLVKFEQRQHMAPDDAAHAMDSNSTALRDATQVIDTLTTKQTPQVPIEYVQKNPFELGIRKPEVKVQRPPVAPVDHSVAIKARIRAALPKLKVDMIMDGTGEKAAVINGEIYKVGDTIGIFRLESVEPQQIFLRHDRYRIPLKVAG